MDIQETNRAKQIAIEKEFIKGVKLIDIDTTIADYMRSTVIPELVENEKPVKVPLVYGNAERWEGARQNGYLRDERGRIQIPLIMFKRNSVERNESMEHFREQLIVSTFRKYSQKNRYDKFSLQNNTKPAYEQYNIAMPSYVTVAYEVMIWTSFTEHMNQIVEQFQYASDRYWGTADGFRFRAKIDSFENQQEVGEGSERLIRTTFTISVNAYLLPEMHGKKPVVKQDYSKKRVVFGIETDLSGDGGDIFTTPTLYNEYAQVIDFVAVRGSQMATFVNSNTVKLTNVKKPILPSELVGVFDIVNWFRVYINGDFISPSLFTYTYNGTLNEITFTFTGLTFAIDAADEVAITGKFQEL
jgi:hypothetical protein